MVAGMTRRSLRLSNTAIDRRPPAGPDTGMVRGLSYARKGLNNMAGDGLQTHEDIPEIPPGVALPDSSGSEVPDVEEPVEVVYEEVQE